MTEPANISAPHMRRAFRYCWRIPVLLMYLAIALPLVMIIVGTPIGNAGSVRHGLRAATIERFSRGLMRVFGFKVVRYGTPLNGSVMFVANHVSWIDIVLLHSQKWMGFVAKHEISRWPFVGWLATIGGTIYHKRGDNESLNGVMGVMLERLREDRAIGVFPEGRTTNGKALGTFHARIFQPAVLASIPAQPVALKYGHQACAQTIVAFAERESFVGNFLRLLGEPSRVCEVHFLEPIAASDDGRRKMAEYCRNKIHEAMTVTR